MKEKFFFLKKWNAKIKSNVTLIFIMLLRLYFFFLKKKERKNNEYLAYYNWHE